MSLDWINARRSIRKYTAETVSEVDVAELLEAAMAAPSAGNQQPWHFIVIRDRGVLNAIPGFHPHASMALHAPVGILVCGDPALEKHTGYWVQDCAAATENLLLAVAAKGLGAVWCGVYPRADRVEGFTRLLRIPTPVIPFAFVPIGHPGGTTPSACTSIAGDRRTGAWP